ncbi:MAG TPA: hypothetical protein VGP16_33110 [Asanoa sp.]|nr:hypothetical protein [Asanoa sp.]
MEFGIYAGGLAADQDGNVTPGPPERADRIEAALDELHGDRPFLVRGYTHYSDVRGGHLEAPPRPDQHAHGRRRLDLVVCFQEPGDDLTGWLAFLRERIRRLAPVLATIQVGEEGNHSGPGGDGGHAAVRRAIVAGVLAARDEVDRLGIDVRVGCNSTPIFDPEQEYWADLGRLGGSEFAGALDYAGLDFFPDVFRPIPPDALADAVRGVVHGFRAGSLAAAGIPPTTPIHITESGWTTGAGRSPERQAEVLETVLRAVAGIAAEAHVAAYEHFALRDADSDRAELEFGFGLLRSDYTPKPAFATFRKLIAELSS